MFNCAPAEKTIAKCKLLYCKCKFLTKFKLSSNILSCALAGTTELELLACMSTASSLLNLVK